MVTCVIGLALASGRSMSVLWLLVSLVQFQCQLSQRLFYGYLCHWLSSSVGQVNVCFMVTCVIGLVLMSGKSTSDLWLLVSLVQFWCQVSQRLFYGFVVIVLVLVSGKSMSVLWLLVSLVQFRCQISQRLFYGFVVIDLVRVSAKSMSVLWFRCYCFSSSVR